MTPQNTLAFLILCTVFVIIWAIKIVTHPAMLQLFKIAWQEFKLYKQNKQP